jgi:hypothetical protein
VRTILIRLGGLAAVVAGILRGLSSVLPATTARIMMLYLLIDVLLLIGSIGLFEFQRRRVGVLGALALVLEIVGALILIARDLYVLSAAVYPAGALMFAIGLDLFAIASWRSRTLPRWILILLIVSTVIGPIGFFSPGFAVLFISSGLLFGIGFASAGVAICLATNGESKSASP